MIDVHYWPTPNGQKVTILLEECGIPYHVVTCSIGTGQQFSAEFLKISPNNGAYIDSYAWVQYKLGNYELALSELKKASDLIDNDAIIFEHLGDVYNALGDKTEAERNYRRALEINPNSIQIEEKLKE